MSYIAIAGFMLTFALSAFGFSYRVSSINRVYFGLYKGLAESSVVTVDEKGRDMDKPLFSKKLFTANLTRYLEDNEYDLPPYRFLIRTFYHATENLDYAERVVVKIDFQITLTKEWTKTASFLIQEGALRA